MTIEDERIPTASNNEGEYLPAGESQGVGDTFSADAIAKAFDVDIRRVHAALEGEFGFSPEVTVDSRQAQHLAEVIIGDLPLDRQEAALMELGAFTPRADHEWGFGEKADDEESDRLVRRGDQGDEERG